MVRARYFISSYGHNWWLREAIFCLKWHISLMPPHLALGEVDGLCLTFLLLFDGLKFARDNNIENLKLSSELQTHRLQLKGTRQQWIRSENADLLSLVGSVFFSWVSVFFSLVLSNWEISLMSGLSAIFLLKVFKTDKNTRYQKHKVFKRQKHIDPSIDTTHTLHLLKVDEQIYPKTTYFCLTYC